MKLVVIDNLEAAEGIIEYFADKDFISYDCETTGLTRQDSVVGISVCADEELAYYIVVHKWDTASSTLVEVFGMKSFAKLLIESIKNKQLIMHNAIFDASIAENYFGISLIQSVHTDTMILAHLLNENRPKGLKDLSREYFGEDATQEQAEMRASVLANGGKVSIKAYEMYKANPHTLGKYGAKDALLTYKLFIILTQELYEQGLEKFFYEDESMPLLKGPTYQLNTTGLQVDHKALMTLKATLKSECAEAKAYIYQEIHNYIKDKYPGVKPKNTFNIGSNQQLSWLLFGQLKLEFNTLTDSGKAICKSIGIPKLPYTGPQKREFIAMCLKASETVHIPAMIHNGKAVKAKKVKEPWAYIAVDKKTLAKLSSKYKWIEKLLEYNRKMKILNTYVEGIEERTAYGIVRPSFLQAGTTSGRYASRDPNFQNLPRDDKRIKECIIARPGKVFVGADYSQLEPRVFAYISGDARLKAAFNGKDDFYSVIGMEVYGIFDAVPLKDGHPDAFGTKYKKLRDLSKVIALASTYGATAFQLAPTTGKGIDDTQEDIDNYFEKFPDVKAMMEESHKIAKTTGQVVNLFGRPRRMPEAMNIQKYYPKVAHKDLKYEFRNLLNLAVNHRVQSTGASIVNRAAIKFYELCKEAVIDCKLVLQVHDSLVVECNESDAEDVATLLQHAMENAVNLDGVRLEAIPQIGANLSKV